MVRNLFQQAPNNIKYAILFNILYTVRKLRERTIYGFHTNYKR